MTLKFWPLSIITPHLPFECQGELFEVEHRGKDHLSQGTVNLAGSVAAFNLGPAHATQAPNLQFIVSEGTNLKRYFSGAPEYREWDLMERAMVYDMGDGTLFLNIDSLQ